MSEIDRHHRLAEIVSDDIAKAIYMDFEIALDHSRYANWLLGFSTGGLALALYKVVELANDSVLAKYGVAEFGFYASISLLVASLIAGVWAKRNVLIAGNLKRVQIACTLAQKSYLLAKDDFEDDLDLMLEKIKSKAYLPLTQRQSEKRSEDEDVGLVHELKLIHVQEWLIALAYVVLLLLSIPTSMQVAA